MSQRVEDIRDNIVKIVDDRGNFHGTGFLIEVKHSKYCITCHHCICRLNKIYVARGTEMWHAEWLEDFSDMSKDIAILENRDISIKSLVYAEAMAELPVFVWGFSYKNLETFPDGAPVENGTLSRAPITFNWKEEDVSYAQKWNKKPQVNVFVFQFSGRFDVGFSGAPVCYTGNNNVV
jgi:hypothetical protein